jgi:hypothetical protein
MMMMMEERLEGQKYEEAGNLKGRIGLLTEPRRLQILAFELLPLTPVRSFSYHAFHRFLLFNRSR